MLLSPCTPLSPSPPCPSPLCHHASYTFANRASLAFRRDFAACRIQPRRLAALYFHTRLPRSARGTNCFSRLARRTLGGQTLCLITIRIARGCGDQLPPVFSVRFVPSLPRLVGVASPFFSAIASSALLKKSTPLQSSNPDSFSETPGVGYVEHPSTPSRTWTRRTQHH